MNRIRQRERSNAADAAGRGVPMRPARTIATGRLIALAAAVALVGGLAAGAGGAMLMNGISPGSDGIGAGPGGTGAFGGANTMSYDYTGDYTGTLTADGDSQSADGKTIEASDGDTNVILSENGGTLTVANATLNKSGAASNDDNANFYGTNSVSLTVGEKSTTILDGSEINATDNGSNGVFVTDSATALVNDIVINTVGDNSRGLDATYGGTILGNKVTATTKGDHSATVATDRGGGNVSIVDSTLNTAGSGSPLLYSTGDVEVSGVTGTATGAQIAGMEGYNTILIDDSTLESTNTGKTGSDPIANGVIIYQSTSGDAESSTGEHATFQAKDSTLKSAIESGSMFYFTNTTADVVLSNTTLDFDTDKATLINASGNDANNWGTPGSNGANVTFTGRSQTLAGDVTADTISTLNLYLLDGTTWTGAATIGENASAGAGSGADSGADSGTDATSDAPISVNVDGTSTWVVTRDTTISALNVASGGKVVDADGNTVTIIANGTTVVTGDSDITVTVTGDYTTTVDAGDETELAADVIDRSAFDKQFGTSTAWTMA